MRRALVRSLTGALCAATGLTTFATAASAATAPVAATSTAVSFTTPGPAIWTVPTGVHRIEVVATGGKGGDSPASSFFRSTGGAGSRVTATVDVTPGQRLEVVVGSGGGSSQWGGAGGGAADVRVAPFALRDRVVVAAGGGGAGADSSQCGVPGTGGAAAGGNGGDGPAQHQDCSPGGTGGKAATDTAGGTGGDAFYVTTHHSGDGGFGTGGVASGDDPTDAVGGGGGSGWYGGGAGGGLYQSFAGSGGGGGAGSDHVAAPAHDATIVHGAGTGAALVTITPVADTVSITTAWTRAHELVLRALAFVSRRSESAVQHDATLAIVGLLDRVAPAGGANARPEWRPDPDTVAVTSTYTQAQGAAIQRVASWLRLDPPRFQEVAVEVTLFLALLHH